MSEAVRRWVVAYDISDDRRRSRVAAAIGGVGDRLQYSVFVVDGKPAQFVRLRGQLLRMIDASRDSLVLIDLGLRDALSTARFERLGVTRRIWSEEDPVV